MKDIKHSAGLGRTAMCDSYEDKLVSVGRNTVDRAISPLALQPRLTKTCEIREYSFNNLQEALETASTLSINLDIIVTGRGCWSTVTDLLSYKS